MSRSRIVPWSNLAKQPIPHHGRSQSHALEKVNLQHGEHVKVNRHVADMSCTIKHGETSQSRDTSDNQVTKQMNHPGNRQLINKQATCTCSSSDDNSVKRNSFSADTTCTTVNVDQCTDTLSKTTTRPITAQRRNSLPLEEKDQLRAVTLDHEPDVASSEPTLHIHSLGLKKRTCGKNRLKTDFDTDRHSVSNMSVHHDQNEENKEMENTRENTFLYNTNFTTENSTDVINTLNTDTCTDFGSKLQECAKRSRHCSGSDNGETRTRGFQSRTCTLISEMSNNDRIAYISTQTIENVQILNRKAGINSMDENVSNQQIESMLNRGKFRRKRFCSGSDSSDSGRSHDKYGSRTNKRVRSELSLSSSLNHSVHMDRNAKQNTKAVCWNLESLSTSHEKYYELPPQKCQQKPNFSDLMLSSRGIVDNNLIPNRPAGSACGTGRFVGNGVNNVTPVTTPISSFSDLVYSSRGASDINVKIPNSNSVDLTFSSRGRGDIIKTTSASRLHSRSNSLALEGGDNVKNKPAAEMRKAANTINRTAIISKTVTSNGSLSGQHCDLDGKNQSPSKLVGRKRFCSGSCVSDVDADHLGDEPSFIVTKRSKSAPQICRSLNNLVNHVPKTLSRSAGGSVQIVAKKVMTGGWNSLPMEPGIIHNQTQTKDVKSHATITSDGPKNRRSNMSEFITNTDSDERDHNIKNKANTSGSKPSTILKNANSNPKENIIQKIHETIVEFDKPQDAEINANTDKVDITALDTVIPLHSEASCKGVNTRPVRHSRKPARRAPGVLLRKDHGGTIWDSVMSAYYNE